MTSTGNVAAHETDKIFEYSKKKNCHKTGINRYAKHFKHISHILTTAKKDETFFTAFKLGRMSFKCRFLVRNMKHVYISAEFSMEQHIWITFEWNVRFTFLSKRQIIDKKKKYVSTLFLWRRNIEAEHKS